MRIIGIGLSKNESDIIEETVRAALSWVDAYVLYDSSTDGTGELAEREGAIVLCGDPLEQFDESLRNHPLEKAASLHPSWIVRIDADEIYHDTPDPRQALERAAEQGATCCRAHVMNFWLTLDDIRRGALLEDEYTSIKKRRRWYTAGATAMVAWQHRPGLRYYPGQPNNVPLDSSRRDVSRLGLDAGFRLIQRHYPCRSLRQVVNRIEDRQKALNSFGKYRYNLIIDEKIGLHYLGEDEVFSFQPNHDLLYCWYDEAQRLYEERGL
jgi:hypothetical protein